VKLLFLNQFNCIF